MEKNKDGSDNIPKPVAIILENRAALAEKLGVKEVHHTPPSMPHYPHLYGWDSAAAIEILAHFGYIREAETEAFSLFSCQRQNGMVANMQRVRGLRSIDPELLTFSHPGESSDYSQPPVWGRTIESLYRAKKIQNPSEARLFGSEILPYAIRSLDYFTNHRGVAPGNPLIFVIKPEETGRDNDESLNGFAPKLPSKGEETPYLVELLNAGSHYVGRIALGGLHRIHGWDPGRIQRYFYLIDPMFNSIYADSLRAVGNLASELDQPKTAERLYDEASAVEERMISDLFVPEANDGKGAFLVRNNKGPKNEISIGCTGPLSNESLSAYHLESILDLADDHLDAPFPWPTMSVKSRHYDPKGRRPHNVWNGDTMMISNWWGVINLRKQAGRAINVFGRPDLAARCLDWSERRIIPRSRQLLKQGSFESFCSQTGRPRRAKTIPGNFVWNGLMETL